MSWKSISLMMALAIGLLLAACSSGKAYNQPLDTVHRSLETIEAPPMIFGSGRVDFALETNTPDKLVWAVSNGGVKRLRFEALLSADSATSTRVSVTAHLAETSPAEAPALDSVGPVVALYKAAMEERIDSTLTHRDFDITATYPYLAAATAANIGTISNQMDAAGEAFRKRDEDNIRKAYADEAAGRTH